MPLANSEGGEMPHRFAAWCLHGIVVRVGAAPFADGFIEHVAGCGVGTTVGNDMRRLIGEVLGGVNNFCFERDLVAYVLTKLDLVNLPGSECHVSLLTTSTVYGDWV
jgi:hypothetical protein